jgi:hypothetical protein
MSTAEFSDFDKTVEHLEGYAPAFPVTIDAGDRMSTNFGMQLRDYFAATAMPLFHGIDVTRMDSDGRELDFSDAAKQAYAYADAMLKARGGK